MSNYNLKTGDVLLFDYEGGFISGFFSSIVKYFTKSNISHVAMVLKDPYFIHPTLKGYYVWESNWEGTPDPQDGHTKFGVQITPFHEIFKKYKDSYGKVYVRRINCMRSLFSDQKLQNIHNVVYNKPYDIIPGDWLEALWRKDSQPQKIDRFWCSALLGYIYVKCGILLNTTDWSILRPSDFSDQYHMLPFFPGIYLGDQEELK